MTTTALSVRTPSFGARILRAFTVVGRELQRTAQAEVNILYARPWLRDAASK